MTETGYTEVSWFHATNSLALVENALAHMAAALTQFIAETPAEVDRVMTFGIEMDIRALHRDSPGTNGWLAVLHHDPFTAAEREAARCDSVLPAEYFTLEQCFDVLVQSVWFTQQVARHQSHTSPSKSRFRLIVKLDFKDPRAAEVFHRHTCVDAGSRLWSSYQQLCARLHPHGELTVWWNADVVPSALLLADAEEPVHGTRAQEAPTTTTTTTTTTDVSAVSGPDSVLAYSLDAHPSLRFIDIPQPLLMDLIGRTVTRNVLVHVSGWSAPAATASLGLSLGWVLKLPAIERQTLSPQEVLDAYVACAPYREADVARMTAFMTRLWSALTASATTTTTMVPVMPELVTYAVLWEAVFAPAKLLGRLCPGVSGSALASVFGKKVAETDGHATGEEDAQACEALTGLMHHTQSLLTGTASTTPCDSPRGFLTFWKVRGEDSLNDPRARHYFRWCTIDG